MWYFLTSLVHNDKLNKLSSQQVNSTGKENLITEVQRGPEYNISCVNIYKLICEIVINVTISEVHSKFYYG